MSKSDDKVKGTSKKKSKSKSRGGLADAIGTERKKSRKMKINRKALKSDDLQESSARLVAYLTSHSTQTLIIVGTIIVLALSAFSINFYVSSRRDKASTLFTKARNLYDMAINETPPSSATLQASLEIFNGLTNTYSGGTEESIAYFYMGNIYYNLKEYDNAIAMYDNFLKSKSPNDTYVTIAKTNIAYSYKGSGEIDQAIIIFRDIADKTDGYLKESALYDLGLAYEKANKADEALKLYQDFVEKYKDSSLIERVQERLNSVQAK